MAFKGSNPITVLLLQLYKIEHHLLTVRLREELHRRNVVADSFTPVVCFFHFNCLKLRLSSLNFLVDLLELGFDGLNLFGPLDAVDLTLHNFSLFNDVKN